MKAIKEFTSAVAFWLAYFLVSPLFGIIGFSVAAVVSLVWWIFIYPVNIAANAIDSRWIHHSNRDHTEKKFIERMFPSGTTLQTLSVFVPFPYKNEQFVVCKLKVVISTAEDAKSRNIPYLVVFHGVGSSATLMLSTTISSLTQHYNVISIDVPGIYL
jgi:hypothetical protein